MARRWARGAVIRRVGKNGVAERAGCKAGDIIVTINGEGVLNAPLSRVEELLQELPVQLELGQPLLEEPIYIREAGRKHGIAFKGWAKGFEYKLHYINIRKRP